jgi:3-oxoacyl-(acyl-carrier-protein) synthase
MAEVGLTGLAVTSALGRGTDALLAGLLAAEAPFSPVRRFDVSGRKVTLAATLSDAGPLPAELADAVDQVCRQARLTSAHRAGTALIVAVHGHPDAPRSGDGAWHSAAELAATLAEHAGLAGVARVYTSACVSASTAVADSAALIRTGRAERIVVVAGYLVESDQLALFDAGRALATDGAVRPFSAGRTGLLLGDAVSAVVLEPVEQARTRGVDVLASIVGWGRAGDGYHACQPHPAGLGMARAIGAALRRAAVPATELGYINAHGTGTLFSDAAESAALHRALGPAAPEVPISSTKATHGHTLEASGLIELVATVLALRAGKLPPTAGFTVPDPQCQLNVIVAAPRSLTSGYALSINAAFGGANTALVVRAP